MIRYSPKKLQILVAMAELGFNQTKFAEQAELDPATISLFLNGKRKISPRTAKKIANTLKKNIDELMLIEVMGDKVVTSNDTTCTS